MSLVDLAPQEALKTFFGFDEFKGEQEHAIQSVLDGRDTFVIMPTGGGKSMCYQLPALMMDGVALVISPLIAARRSGPGPSMMAARVLVRIRFLVFTAPIRRTRSEYELGNGSEATSAMPGWAK